jgi:PadR family transcriptional regulator PadR
VNHWLKIQLPYPAAVSFLLYIAKHCILQNNIVMNNAQFKKGILPLCVLTLLSREDGYGYDLTTRIAQELDVKAGTIYLVLGRLKESGYVTTYLKEAEKGPARKYYHLTKTGRTYQKQLLDEWNRFSESTGRLLNHG